MRWKKMLQKENCVCKETMYQLSRIRSSVRVAKDLAKTESLEPVNGCQ